MANVLGTQQMGDQMVVMFDDNTQVICSPTPSGYWVATGSGSGPGPGPSGDLADWWTEDYGQGSFGDWESHASYSRGGTDWSTPYGTPLKASAAGTIVNYPNEDAAGLKTMLVFTASFPRTKPASTTLMNGVYVENPTAPAVAQMFQHLSSQVPAGPVAKGGIIGYSGNSALGVEDPATHLHMHLLAGTSVGSDRLDFMKFL